MQELSNKILSEVVVHTKYSKFIPSLKRRESWEEIVTRNKMMHLKKFPKLYKEITAAYQYVYDRKVLPSMRSLQFGGKPIELNNARLFNCSFLPMTHYACFSEVMFLLLSGCGVGYSVQRHHVEQLPEIHKSNKTRRYLIGDSIEGWADAVKILMKSYFMNKPAPLFDFSDIRPKGAALITSGGKAPGPEPLKECLFKIQQILDRKADGDKLSTLEVHDINCHIADAVLSGGIRRCIAENSRVVVRGNGFLPIQDVSVGDYVSTPEGWKQVKNTFVQGKQNTVKIKHTNGEFICTPNHRMAVLTGIHDYTWKRADELVNGDRLFSVYNEDDFGKNELPQLEYSISDKVTVITNITIPNLTEEVAWLIGAIHGDGYVFLSDTHGRITVASNEESPEYTEKLVNAFKSFGINASVNTVKNERTIVVRACSRQLASYFHQHIKQPNVPIRIPDFIKRATPSVRAAYLQGVMDADGSIKTRPQQAVCTIYPEFAKDIQSLYASIGVVTRFKQLFTTQNKNWKQKYGVAFINNCDKHTFLSRQTYTGCKSVFGNNGQFNDGYLFEHLDNKPRGMCHNATAQITIDRASSYGYDVSYHPSTIINVEPNGESNTYDIEVEDAHCFVCEGVITHNSAMIALFNLDDEEMLTSKFGNWYETDPQRGRSNNSAVILRHKIDQETFFQLWNKIEASNAGEPGFFFTNSQDWGLNPCAEISLRAFQFCNLTTINAASITGQDDLNERAVAAAFIGTLQASYTNFHYLRDVWKRTTEKEALIGVSMTGIASGTVLGLDLELAAKLVKTENERVAELIGINKAARTTTVKPEGTTSLVVGSSSGIHAWHSKHYIRRMRLGKNEAIYHYLNDNHPNLLEDDYFKPTIQSILSVPQKAPDDAITREESALELLNRVSDVWKRWVKVGHRKGDNVNNVSCTVTVKSHEWFEVGEWMWMHRTEFTALSVLPFDGGSYTQAPYEDCTQEEYEAMMTTLSDIDLTKVVEMQDETNLQSEVACGGGGCEVT